VQLPSLSQIKAERQRRESERLAGYIPLAWNVIEPATEFLSNWHIDLMAEYLEACYSREITRLIINVPPRYMKSIAVTVAFPTWAWTKDPALRFQTASYSQSLSTKHSKDRRDIVASPWYQGIWGDDFQLTDDQNQKTEFENSAKGVMIATSVGGTSTGKGGDFLIVDDPHNPREAESDVQRQSAIEWFDQTFSTRLNDKRRGVIIVVMQRLHERDLTGHLLSGTEKWDHLCLPAVAEKHTVVNFPSGRQVEREDQSLLWPEREGPEQIASMQGRLGSYGFAGQYQQSPSPREGGMVKRDWWRRFTNPPVFDKLIQSWDLAFKGTTDSDWVVGQVWGMAGANAYLVDQVRGKMDISETIRAIIDMTAKHPKTRAKYVEDKANGPAVIALLKNRIPGLIPVNPEGGKIVRANAVAPFIESGNVYLADDAPWVLDFIEEWAVFPAGANDDQVDAASQALNQLFLKVKPTPSFITLD